MPPLLFSPLQHGKARAGARRKVGHSPISGNAHGRGVLVRARPLRIAGKSPACGGLRRAPVHLDPCRRAILRKVEAKGATSGATSTHRKPSKRGGAAVSALIPVHSREPTRAPCPRKRAYRIDKRKKRRQTTSARKRGSCHERKSRCAGASSERAPRTARWAVRGASPNLSPTRCRTFARLRAALAAAR